MSFDAFVRDIETVADSLGLNRFALFGLSQGAALSIAYAAKNPGRVSHLILSGGFGKGWRLLGNPAEIARREALMTLIRHGWGLDNPAFRQVFASRLFPDATPDTMHWLNELQRVSTSPDNAVRVQEALAEFDVTGLLSCVTTPTLVLHSSGDGASPIGLGLALARGIPNARFVEIDSRNHIPLSHEPSYSRYLAEITGFLEEPTENQLPGRTA